MLSVRRVKVTGVVVVVACITLLFYLSSLRQSPSQKSQRSAEYSLKSKKTFGDEYRRQASPNQLDQQSEFNSPHVAELPLGVKINPVKPDRPSKLIDVGSAAHRLSFHTKLTRELDKPEKAQEPIRVETDEEHEIEQLLDRVLKKSPIIIFSKTYCRFSQQAKNILLTKYTVDPEPFVLELDQQPLGNQIQDFLGNLTARYTVPNILVNGVSIGGKDELAMLDQNQSLIEKIKYLGGNRINIRLSAGKQVEKGK